jgi:arylsulfatase A-like enzyme
MPAVEALANQGLRFNEFHTTALCSPTRAALLSGRNHHINNMSLITETATDDAIAVAWRLGFINKHGRM